METDGDPLLDIRKAFQAGNFPVATARAREVLLAAASGPDLEFKRLAEALTDPGFQLCFNNVKRFEGAAPFFETIVQGVQAHGKSDALLAKAYLALGSIYALTDAPAAAAEAYERALERFPSRGFLDPNRQLLCSNLAIQYRRLGQPEKVDALYQHSGICEHLLTVEQYVRSHGARVASIGTPWSRNCRTWVIFENVVLDALALQKRFALPGFVVVHDFEDRWQGSEYGLVCERDHDALIGRNPRSAPAQTPRIG